MRIAAPLAVTVVALVLLSPFAGAQSKSSGSKPSASKPAPGKPSVAPSAKPTAPAAAKPAPTAPQLSKALSSLQFAASELPAGLALADGEHFISVQARNFYATPDMAGPILPAPLGKCCQSFKKGKTVLGSVAAIEFAAPLDEGASGFLRADMWGEDKPSKEHPEHLLFVGRFFVIISLPDGEPTTAWFELQFQARLEAFKPHDWTSLQPLMDKATDEMNGGGADQALALLQQYADKIQDYALAQYVLGEAALAQKQWPVAQAAYARALELHDAGQDVLTGGPPMVWGAVDGLALALLHQDSNEQAVPVLERGVGLVRGLGDDKQTSGALYNYACGLARVGRFEDSLKALTESIQLAPDHKAMAAKDSDFAKARERPDFKKLLAD